MGSGDVTFGCGELSPGFGPGGFSDGDWGGGCDCPNNGGGPWVNWDGEKVGGGGPGGPGGPGPGDGTGPWFSIWWVCSGKPKWECSEIQVHDGNPPPPGAWKTQKACQDNCEGAGGGTGGVTPGGAPGAPGPSAPPTPGGGGPGAPGGGGISICECKIVGKPNISYYHTKNTKGVIIKWKQKCSPGQESGGQAKIDKTVDEQLKSLDNVPGMWTCVKMYQVGQLGADCKEYTIEGETCTAKCDKIIVYLECTRNIIGGGARSDAGVVPPNGDGIFTGGEKTGGRNAPPGPGTPGGPPLVPPGGGSGKPYWYCADTGGVKGCRYDNGWGPKTLTFLTEAQCMLFCHDDDNGDDWVKIIDQGARHDTGAEGIESSNQNSPPPPFTPLPRIPPISGSKVLFTRNLIDLNSLSIRHYMSKNFSTGIMDPEIAITAAHPTRDFITNSNRRDPIFGKTIHKSIEYLLERNNSYKDWDSTQVYNLTQTNIINSLNFEFLSNLRNIIKIDGSKVTDFEIYNLVNSKLVDGTIGDLDTASYVDIKNKSQVNKTFSIKRSVNPTINEFAAISLLETDLVALDPSAHTGFDAEILKNWKVLSTDINKYIEVKVDGVIKSYYIRDDNILLGRTSLSVTDGEYFIIKKGGKEYRIYCKSQKNHAYIVSEKIRQKAIKLMGGTGKRILSVSADTSAGMEFNYSLSSSRQNVYVMKLILSSVDTNKSLIGSNLLKNTSCRYDLMDSSSARGVESINEYIRYKANYRPYFLSHDDLIFDYIESTGSLYISQEDILFDAPKTNWRQPLLLRQIPPTIFVIPSNRENYLPYGSKSTILSVDPSGGTTRQLPCSPSIDPRLSDPANNTFISYTTPYFDGIPDVFGALDTQIRISVFSPTDPIYTTTCVSAAEVGGAEDFPFVRKKTTFRLLKEIINELNDNYILDREGIGLGINTFDVISRLGMTEFNKFTAFENSRVLFPLIREGLFANVRVYPPVKNSGLDREKKTRIVQRRAGVPKDLFLPIKAMANGEYILPPSTIPYSSTFGEEPNLEKNQSIPGSRD